MLNRRNRHSEEDIMDKEVEEVTFLPGETILNKKAVYEPTKGQRFRQIVCTRGWAVFFLMASTTVIVGVALIAAFARPAAPVCNNSAAVGVQVQGQSSANSGSKVTDADTKKSEGKQESFIATNGRPFPYRDLRLPKSLVPQAYDIMLHPNISRSEFTGHVDMTLRVVEETDEVIFHVNKLNISGMSVFTTFPGGASQSRREQPIGVIDRLEYATNQLYYVKLSESLSAGSYVRVTVSFSGQLASDDMSGFYLSSYTVKGEERQMASTQFEATDARKAFPCLDEPAMKATFKLSIVREARHITLFNMPLEKTEAYGDSHNLFIDRYPASPKMSTYLVAFVVCDFKNVSATTKSGTLVRVFAPEDKIYMGRYALNAAVTVLENYTSFFGLPYDLPKADLVAVPNFAAGAMENWGLVTYRDTAILYDPAVSSLSAKKWVTLVVAHELAHQWFGNLVTMDWWDDLWLNEGFATFVQFIGMDAIDENSHGDNLLSIKYTDALYKDSLTHSHPVKVPVKNPTEIAAVFDSISYEKGGSVIRMLESVIGKESFKTGLRNYLTEHKLGNARTQDLWTALQQASTREGLSVLDMMETWTLQMGYPVVKVERVGSSLKLSQQRFLLNQPDGTLDTAGEKYPSPFGYKWYIPFSYTTSQQPDQTSLVFLKEESMTVSLPSTTSNLAWVKGNADLRGFYRVNYDLQGWTALTQQLKTDHSVFSVNDRVNLLDDAFSLARAGHLNYSIALDLLQYLGEETNYYVWSVVLPHLQFLLNRLSLEEEYDLMREMELKLLRPEINTLGWDDQGDLNTRQLRASLITAALTLEDPNTVEKAKMLFEGWRRDENITMNNDLRSAVYDTGVKYGNKASWDLVFDRYQRSKVVSDRSALMMALAATRDARVLQILLDYTLDSDKIKSQDSSFVVTRVGINRNGLLLAWRFLRQNWDHFLNRYGTDSSILRGMVHLVTNFNTQFDLDEVETFFKGKTLGSASSELKQGLELVKSHVAWNVKNMDTVKAWLIKNVQPSNAK